MCKISKKYFRKCVNSLHKKSKKYKELSGKAYVELAYMTGILPIAKYSGGSELNMFLEYDIATKKRFSEYFGLCA